MRLSFPRHRAALPWQAESLPPAKSRILSSFEYRSKKIANIVTSNRKMKLCGLAAVILSSAPFQNNAFIVPAGSVQRRRTVLNGESSLHEFDFLLQETADPEVNEQAVGQSRRRIAVSGDSERATVFASSTFAQPDAQEYAEEEAAAAEAEADPYAEIGEAGPGMVKLQEQSADSSSLVGKLKEMDFQDVVSTLIVPSILAFVGLRWSFNRVAERVSGKADDLLDSFASEMIYHDGDFEEMKMCHSDYTKKLVWLGPGKTQTMLKNYLQLYAKKRTVSPQAIR